MRKTGTSRAKKSGHTRPRAAQSPVAHAINNTDQPSRPNKLLTIIAMLRRPEGATLAELTAATGWKPNSVRGVISGAIKKRRLMKVSSDLNSGVRTYRIAG